MIPIYLCLKPLLRFAGQAAAEETDLSVMTSLFKSLVGLYFSYSLKVLPLERHTQSADSFDQLKCLCRRPCWTLLGNAGMP